MVMKFPVLPNPRTQAAAALLAAAVAFAAHGVGALRGWPTIRVRRAPPRIANDNEPGLGVAGARFRLV